jgi:hemolysin III
MIDKRDFWSCIVNGIGFLFFIIAIPLLLTPERLQDTINSPSLWIYAIVLLVFWPIQISYHALITADNEREVLRRIDRGSMLFLVSALFTPVLWKFGWDSVGLIILILLWSIAIVGMILLLTIKNLSRKLTPILGFFIGIIGIIGVIIHMNQIQPLGQIFFVFGAIFLILGGAVYAIKKPDIKKEIFGFHEVYHTLNLIGCIFLHLLIISL